MATNDPMFAQFPLHDALISKWFMSKGWPVTMRHFDVDRGVFAWRHEDGSICRTMRITRTTLEDYPPDMVLKMFAEARLDQVLTLHADKYVVLRRRSTGALGVDILEIP